MLELTHITEQNIMNALWKRSEPATTLQVLEAVFGGQVEPGNTKRFGQRLFEALMRLKDQGRVAIVNPGELWALSVMERQLSAHNMLTASIMQLTKVIVEKATPDVMPLRDAIIAIQTELGSHKDEEGSIRARVGKLETITYEVTGQHSP